MQQLAEKAHNNPFFPQLERIALDRIHLSRAVRTRFRGISTIAITTGGAELMRRGLAGY